MDIPELNIEELITPEALAFGTVALAIFSILKVFFEVSKAGRHKKKIHEGKNRSFMSRAFDVIGVISTPLELAYNTAGLFRALGKYDGIIRTLAVFCILQQLSALLYKWSSEWSFIHYTWRFRPKKYVLGTRKAMRIIVFISSLIHLYFRVYTGMYTRVASFIQLLGSGVIAAASVSAITRTQKEELCMAQQRMFFTAIQGLGLVGCLGTIVPVASGDGRVENVTEWFTNTAECTFILTVIEAAALDTISTYFEVDDRLNQGALKYSGP